MSERILTNLMVPSAATRRLSTAEARREEVLAAALRVFAAHGLHGTATADIARAAGLSQAYLFRLFPTKSELYCAVVRRCFERTLAAFRDAAEAAGAEGRDPLEAMGEAYTELLADRDLLLGQLHAYAAAPEDDDVRAVTREGIAALHDLACRTSGAEPQRVREWFAHGMLCNLVAALRADEVDAPWARTLQLSKDCLA